MSSSRCSVCGADVRSLGEDSESKIAVAATSAATSQHQPSGTSNEPLESADIRSVVSTTGARLADLEDEISRLRTRLQQLEDEHASLSRYRLQNNAVLGRMPAEVLSEIFLWTLPSLSTALDRSKFDVNNSPWVLTQVSSHWRTIAISIPSLWSLVVIDYAKSSFYPLPMLQIQLQRARMLRIHFYGHEGLNSGQTEIFRCLADHSVRWEELCIELTSDLFPILDTLQHRLSALRRLWIQWAEPESQAGVESALCFETASSLLDVGILNRYRYLPIILPIHQLTRYNLDAPWTVHEGILKLAPNLVEASIDIRFEEEHWPTPGDIIDLKCLRRLYISHTGGLKYLRAPALQEISLYNYDDDDPVHDLEPFLVRSSCAIRRLSLQASLETHTITEILRKAPSIVELAILTDNPEASAEIAALVANLTVTDPLGSTMIAPHLSYMLFGCIGKGYIDHALHLKMLQSRWDAGNCALKAATLLKRSGPGPNPATLRGLDALRQDGMYISLLDGDEALDVIRAFTYSPSWN
ncbi:hypothetical protein DFH09DRAFT_1439925 [Mycena vulgaris]|nr:hypothetical protein DFH09DRAFT_1439925 [Mycena vulgaris]